MPLATAIFSTLIALHITPFAQGDRVVIDQARVPLEADTARDFAPRGWDVEEQVSGDLNGDGVPDLALKLIRNRAAGNGESGRYRALVILFKGGDGKLRRVGVAGKLLQCTSCGGAFYGVGEAPANVRISKGCWLSPRIMDRGM